jgi:pimeloyl-ACP methyl ester carboxylesterase
MVTKARLRNYGPDDYSWRLWHRGPVHDRQNVVLVHGFMLPWFRKRGGYDSQFRGLYELLQRHEDQYDVWQFGYYHNLWGTPGAVGAYASKLNKAIEKVGEITGQSTCSIVAYSMGGIVARQYIAMCGKSKVDKLLTLATPHMGTLLFEPFNLKYSDRFMPRAAAELRPDSRLLWDLNTKVERSIVPNFASIGGLSWRHTDGLIELSSTSLVKSNPDGSVGTNFYFAVVNRSHLNINSVGEMTDEVFQLIQSFLHAGVAGISGLTPAEYPGDYDVPSYLTFAVKRKPRQRLAYPSVVVEQTGRRYLGYKVFSQGDRTKEGAHIFTVRLQPQDDGEARIAYAPGRYATVRVHKGQSTIVAEPIGEGAVNPERVPLAA